MKPSLKLDRCPLSLGSRAGGGNLKLPSEKGLGLLIPGGREGDRKGLRAVS